MKNENNFQKILDLFKDSQRLRKNWKNLSDDLSKNFKTQFKEIGKLEKILEEEFQILIRSSIVDCRNSYISLKKLGYSEFGISKSIGFKFKYDKYGGFNVFIPEMKVLNDGFILRDLVYPVSIERKVISFKPLLEDPKVNQDKVKKWLSYAKKYMNIRNKYKWFENAYCEEKIEHFEVRKNEYIDIRFCIESEEPRFNCKERPYFGDEVFSKLCNEYMSSLDSELAKKLSILPLRIINNWNKISNFLDRERKLQSECIQDLKGIDTLLKKENTAFRVLRKLR